MTSDLELAGGRRRRRARAVRVISVSPTKLGDYTHTRAGSATYRSSDARLFTAPSGTLRNAHYQNNRFNVLIERESRTNNYLQSEDLTQAAWVKTACTISANLSSDPTTAANADKVIPSAVNTAHYIAQTLPALTDNLLQSASAFCSAFGYNWVMVETINKANVTRRAWVNLSTGTFGTVDSGITARLVRYNYSNDYYRIELTFDSGAGATTPVVRWYVVNGDNVVSFLGDGTSGTLIWGLQFEADSGWPSSYIPTTTATVTRVVDEFSFNVNFTFPVFSAYIRFIDTNLNRYFPPGGGAATLFYIRGGTATPWVRTARSGAGSNLWLFFGDASPSISVAGAGGPGDNQELRLTQTMSKVLRGAVSLNEAAEVASGNSPGPATTEGVITKIHIGWAGTGVDAGNVMFDRFILVLQEDVNFTQFRSMP